MYLFLAFCTNLVNFALHVYHGRMSLQLIVPSFVAGLLMFLAPCTLPLVPAYLGFISGISFTEIRDKEKLRQVRWRIFLNGVLFVIGFSSVFIILGGAFGLAGSFIAPYRVWLARIGGLVVILFGVYLLDLFEWKALAFLNKERRFPLGGVLRPGRPFSSLLFGATFAFGWTPCIGPVLASVLLLASTSATAFNGAFLLLVFSLGFSIPFLLLALLIGRAVEILKPFQKHMKLLSQLAGVFLILLGFLLVTNSFGTWIAFVYQHLTFFRYESLLRFL